MIRKSNRFKYADWKSIIFTVYIVICVFVSFDTNKMLQSNNNHDTSLSIVAWNSRGSVASIPYLRELMKMNDVVCVSEHWLHANRLNILEDLSADFNVVARASAHSGAEVYGTKRGQGGVACFWKKSLGGVSPITDISHDRVCGIRVQTNLGIILNIYSIYMPAPGCADDFDIVLDEIAEIVNTRENGTFCVLAGDFNADMGHLGGPRSNRKPSKVGKKLAKFFDESELTAANMTSKATGPLNTFNSGNGSSTIDYIAVPNSLCSLVRGCSVMKDEILNTSDHFAIQATLDVKCCEMSSINSRPNTSIKWGKIRREIIDEVYTRPVEEYATQIMNELELCKDSVIENSTVECLFDGLIDKMASCSSKLPKKRYKPNARPYWNERLTMLKKEKIRCFRKWVYLGRPKTENCVEWLEYKDAKRIFRREIKYIQNEYEKKEMEELIRTAECDKNKFWSRVKRSRRNIKTNSYAVKNKKGTVVQELSEVVKVWEEHFSNLSKEKMDKRFDEAHYKQVSEQVKFWYAERDADEFLKSEFTLNEIESAVRSLNRGKAPGFDLITSEHLQHTGFKCMRLLTGLFNLIVRNEYVPKNFKIGMQIPLYKGKSTCSLDPNNYRGITLLTALNKVFEMVIWNRMKDWWKEERIISNLQGACKTGMSCVHSALVLQETIAVGLDARKKVFVAYFDVAKAFDSVWIDGLFYNLHKMGIRGRVWRLLYQTYQDFWCKVRIGGTMSDWYRMQCGIHQGGFLSLLKYTAFIDPLIRSLEASGLGCQVVGIPTSPVGYADDMAACSLSKQKLDRSLELVTEYSNKWRYSYNASKSAIMVYGENVREMKNGKKHRSFTLCKKKVKETESYDHVGIKNCLFNNYRPRTDERISKGRRAFNAVTSVGIKKKGISMRVCSSLFWSIIAPITTYGCEIWVLRGDEIEMLRKFQRMVGRRCQRFPQRSPNYSAYSSMGWLSIDRYIQGKKLMFLRTILELEDDAICKRLLYERSLEYANQRAKASTNEHDSPIYDLLNTSADIGLYEVCMNMIRNEHHYTKQEWKVIVWEKIWKMEDKDCNRMYIDGRDTPMLFKVLSKPYYLIWWIISDQFPKMITMCEKMAAIVSDASKLKANDVKLKSSSFWAKTCTRCELSQIENAKHILMQCPFYENDRLEMYNELEALQCDEINRGLSDTQNLAYMLLGRQPEYMSLENMFKLCTVSGKYISKIYDSITVR